MTGGYRKLHAREAELLGTLQAMDALNPREVMLIRVEYLSNPAHESLLGLLRERGHTEDTLRSALINMGVPDGGLGETPDPLHPLVIDQHLPYTNAASEELEVPVTRVVEFERLSDALDRLGVPIEDDQ